MLQSSDAKNGHLRSKYNYQIIEIKALQDPEMDRNATAHGIIMWSVSPPHPPEAASNKQGGQKNSKMSPDKANIPIFVSSNKIQYIKWFALRGPALEPDLEITDDTKYSGVPADWDANAGTHSASAALVTNRVSDQIQGAGLKL